MKGEMKSSFLSYIFIDVHANVIQASELYICIQ